MELFLIKIREFIRKLPVIPGIARAVFRKVPSLRIAMGSPAAEDTDRIGVLNKKLQIKTIFLLPFDPAVPAVYHPAGGPDRSVFQQNLEVLGQFQPALASALKDVAEDDSVSVVLSDTGPAVPVIDGIPLHSIKDPEGEASEILTSIEQECYPQRMVFFGCGFGYHFMPLVKKGLSAIIIEPDLQILKHLFSHLDLRSVLPFVKFFVPRCPEELPDIPRLTKIFLHPAARIHYPDLVAAMLNKMETSFPGRVDNINEGIFYESYRDVSCVKNPCDLVAYQMLFFMVRPTFVIEIGSYRGGSALYFADLLRLLGGHRRLYTFDTMNALAPEAAQDRMIHFSSDGWQSFDSSVIRPDDRVLVIEDSAHTYENTLGVLRKFAPVTSPNSYMIIEDGISSVTHPEFQGGPLKAIAEFLNENLEFEVDSRWERLFGSGNSFNLKGFLRKKLKGSAPTPALYRTYH